MTRALRAVCALLLLLVAAPGQASVLYPDEPAGWSQLLRHQFNDKTNGGTCSDYYPDSSGKYATILSDGSAWTSPSSFLRETKPAGQSVGGTQLECVFPAKRSIFWGFTFRTSNPFGGYNNAANKYGFMMTNRPTGGGALWGLHYYGNSNGSRVISVFLQAVTVNNCHLSNFYGDCNGSSFVILPNVNASPVVEGQIHKVEVTMIRSTSETSKDGTIRVVVDGVVRTNYTNVNFPAWDFVSVQTNHTWDGQCATRNTSVGPTTPPNDCRTFDDWYDTDDWYVSSGAGGGGGTAPPPPPPLPPNMPTNLRVQ